MNELGQPLITAKLVDDDSDDKMDRFDVHIEIKSLSGRSVPIAQSIRNVRVIGTVDYSLQKNVKLDMIGLFHLNMDTPSGAARIKSTGQLDLIQDSPSSVDSLKRTNFKVNPFDDYTLYSLQEVIEFYSSRKGKPKNNSHSNFIERTTYTETNLLVQPYGNVEKVVLDISVKIPRTQRVRYVPGILETLKHAWIQYLALLLPAIWIFQEFVGFLFRYKILEANVVADLNNKRII